MIKTTNNVNNILLSYVIVLYAVCCCTPKFALSEYFLLPFVLGGMFVLSVFGKLLSNNNLVLTLLVLLYSLLVIFYNLLGISSTSPAEVFQHLQFFFFILIMELMAGVKEKKKLRIAFFMAVLIVAVNVVDNIYISILYPEINTMRHYMDEKFLAQINAGGGWFYTMSLFFFNICFFGFMHSGEKLKIAMLICSIFSAIYIIGYCNKASVVVFFIMSLLLQLLAYKCKSVKTFYVSCFVVAGIATLLVGALQEVIVDFIISVSPSDRLTQRLVLLVDANNVEANESTLTSRQNLYWLSIETWLSNISSFLFGIGDHRASFDVEKTGIGQHSDFADSLARYGVLGLSLLLPILIKAFKLLMSFFDKKYRTSVVCIIIAFICCGITKKVFLPSAGFLLFILFPLFSLYSLF